MKLRQAVAFAILMGADLRSYAPDYILEKVQECEMLAVPEVLLDSQNLGKFKEWAQLWGLVWNKERDVMRSRFDVLEEG